MIFALHRRWKRYMYTLNTLAELKDVCKNFIPVEKTIKSKLIERYGEKIVITTKKYKFDEYLLYKCAARFFE